MIPGFHGMDLIVTLAFTAFWIWMLVDCLSNKRLNRGEKIGWLLIIFFAHTLGAVIYFFTARSSKSSRPSQSVPQSPSAPIYQPTQAAPTEPSRDYQQGYPAQSEQLPIMQESADWQHDEEPLATYPEMPPQVMPPQQR